LPHRQGGGRDLSRRTKNAGAERTPRYYYYYYYYYYFRNRLPSLPGPGFPLQGNKGRGSLAENAERT